MYVGNRGILPARSEPILSLLAHDEVEESHDELYSKGREEAWVAAQLNMHYEMH